MKVNADLFSDILVEEVKPILTFDPSKDLDEYKAELKEKLIELLGIKKIEENACPVTLDKEYEKDMGTYIKIRFTVETEKNNNVPCYLLLPKLGKEKYPLCIVLQGHTNGMYHSIGEVKEPGDEAGKVNRAFGLQAVEEGYAALCIEQRGMGEQKAFKEFRQWENGGKCKFLGFSALILGRTLIGERCWDVSKVLDVVSTFEQLDMNDIMITGCSGGGTASFYAACYDERIKLSAPDCAFCPYKESILAMYHCICNYIPHAYEWFDMQDLSALIAPRKLLVMAGVKDRIFPIDAVRRGYKTAEKIYEKAGVSSHLRLLETPLDHHWCEDMTWKAIADFRKEK
ncbi:MAG: alpha/beta hydrolase family protein [Bacilli bacterium]|nr:alpha/beta hydrolase family protein [Bacilli bacterium]